MWQSIKNIYHLFQAIIALLWYRFPARGMTIIGVTGTDGKTTTASLIYHVLSHSGRKAALISSLSAVIDGKTYDIGFHVTTPHSFGIQHYLRKAKDQGIKFVVLEVTSHALDQYRVFGVPFAIGVITNVAREHLDYHKTYERYVKAKARLLKIARVAVVNKDDQSYQRIKKHELKDKEKKVVTYGLKNDAIINPHNFQFHTKLIGKFNKYNCLAAIAALREAHISDDQIRKGIASFKPPQGRQEIVYPSTGSRANDFSVIIDFAHTPQSFANVLPEIRKITKGRLIHVFGAAAKRDVFKRPEMGKLSSEYADVIVLTAEDPRNEPIEKINNEIAIGIRGAGFEQIDDPGIRNQDSGIMDNKKYLVEIPDRREAIGFAIGLAKRGDVVLLTGKGHEKSMNYGKGEEPWSEHEVVEEAIEKRKNI
jgi:UDP-N-acetylmuramoyl-L-alanyl-D-glutamate--2,6-diaminopimelate ligase